MEDKIKYFYTVKFKQTYLKRLILDTDDQEQTYPPKI